MILFSGMNGKNWVERGLERERGGDLGDIVFWYELEELG